MIKVLIKRAAKKRGLKNAYQFGQSVGLSDRVALRIWNNEQPPKLKTLDRICNAFRCSLDELIEHRLDRSTNGHTPGLSPVGRRSNEPDESGPKVARRAAARRSR